jgi:hypothetical protein
VHDGTLLTHNACKLTESLGSKIMPALVGATVRVVPAAVVICGTVNVPAIAVLPLEPAMVNLLPFTVTSPFRLVTPLTVVAPLSVVAPVTVAPAFRDARADIAKEPATIVFPLLEAIVNLSFPLLTFLPRRGVCQCIGNCRHIACMVIP